MFRRTREIFNLTPKKNQNPLSTASGLLVQQKETMASNLFTNYLGCVFKFETTLKVKFDSDDSH